MALLASASARQPEGNPVEASLGGPCVQGGNNSDRKDSVDVEREKLIVEQNIS